MLYNKKIILDNTLLNERAPPLASKYAQSIIDNIVSKLNVDEMRFKRGADYDTTQYYQIRVKPRLKELDLEIILKNIEQFLIKNSKKMGLTRIQVNPKSFNSGKYSSVSFNFLDIDFDIVVAAGANKGEKFERELLVQMDNLINNIETSKLAEAAFASLENANSELKINNIKSIQPRTGKTFRSIEMSPKEIGKVIADIILITKNNKEHYISVKNKLGTTIAQFGISNAFNDDCTININSQEWKTWLAPFNLNIKMIEEGLKAAEGGTKLKWNDIVEINKSLPKTSKVYNILQKMWGSNYYYLRQIGPNKFKCFFVDENFIHNTLLKNLKITQIYYPYLGRKQISIFLENMIAKYKIEIRNPRGKGSVRPTQIQLSMQKNLL